MCTGSYLIAGVVRAQLTCAENRVFGPAGDGRRGHVSPGYAGVRGAQVRHAREAGICVGQVRVAGIRCLVPRVSNASRSGTLVRL